MQIVVGACLLVVVLVAWVLERRSFRPASVLLVGATGLVLLIDALLSGPLPGRWELSAVGMMAWACFRWMQMCRTP